MIFMTRLPRFTVYAFQFSDGADVSRIPYAKWCRIRAGEEVVDEYASKVIRIAYAYISLVNSKPDFCSRIEGVNYYFDDSGRILSDAPCYFDLLQDLEEDTGGVINLQHRKKKKDFSDKYQWELNSQQVQAVLDCVW